MVTSKSLLEMSEISLNMDQNNNRSPVKKPELSRKKRKPLMEKRRRARINASLEQLKKLVLDATRRDSARYSKLEKADILELTVRHLRDTQRNNINYAMHQDPSVLAKFGDGFGECVGEVNRYLSTIDGLPTEVRSRLMGHLSSCVQKVYAVSSNPARLPDFTAAPPLTPPHTGGPPPPLPFVLNQQGIPVFQHNIPVGMMSPPPTPTATPIRVLPGHNAHMSPPNSPTGNIQDLIMHQSSNIVTDSKRPHSESSQPKSPNSYAGQEMFSRPLPHVAGRHFFGDKVMYDHIPIKQEPREHLFMRGENGSVLLREHARFVESMQMLKDSVWRPW